MTLIGAVGTDRGPARRAAVVLLLAPGVLLSLAQPAGAAVSITRAELRGTDLRLEGTAAPSRDITVDGVVLGRSSATGVVRIERTGYAAPADCTVDVGDGSGATATRLSGCSVAAQPPPPAQDTTAPSAPTGLTATVVGTTASLSWTASSDAVGVTGYGITRNGAALPGTTSATTASDTGLAPGTYSYTVAAFDAAGNVSAASASATATVAAAEGLSFLTAPGLPDAAVGQAYLAYVVSSDPPGPSTFRFKLVSGRVPDGTRLSGNTLDTRPEARVTGTPTSAGTSTFTVEVSDGTGATARRSFTVTVLAA